MGRFAVRRIVQGLVVIVGVTIVVFVVTRLVGDPVDKLLPIEATVEQRRAFEAELCANQNLCLDEPIWVQFGQYMRQLASFNLGESLWQSRAVTEIVLEALPRTFQLVLPAILLSVLLAIPLGVFAALKPGRALDRAMVVLSLVGLSVPQFWLGLLLILVFSVTLKILPTSGIGGIDNMVLPVVALALPAVGRLAMIVRSSMIDELNQQYVRMASAKGIAYSRVVGVHALRNAAIPAVTLTGWELIRALAGYSVIVETVFQWPGIGFLSIQAINRDDLILLQGIVFVVALMVVLVNISVDVAYKAIDPRIKLA
jgi:peptide/nickel transport system permease protein